MNLIFELFLGGFIAKIIGLYSRYYLFRIIGYEKSVDYLSGNTKDNMNNVSQKLFNFIVGTIISLLLFLGVAFLVDKFILKI